MKRSAPCSGQRHRPAKRRNTWYRQTLHGLSLLYGLFVLGGCDAAQPKMSAVPPGIAATVQSEEVHMWMMVGEHRFAITLIDTEAARAFTSLLPLTIDMADLNGNEKHAKLPKALPTRASRPGTIHNGDLMLYGSQTLVVFYLTFDSPYSYTPLGRIDDPAGLAQALGSDDVRIVFAKN